MPLDAMMRCELRPLDTNKTGNNRMDRSETNKTKDIDQQFRQLISEELPTLRGGVYRIVGNAADTDDVIQNAMLRAYRQFDTFKNQASLRTWVYRIAVNCAFDWMRKKKRDSEMLRGYVENVESEQEERRDHHEEEQFQALEKAIAELPETYREAIVWGCLKIGRAHV